MRSAFGIASARYARQPARRALADAPPPPAAGSPHSGQKEYFAPVELSPKVLAFLEPIKYGTVKGATSDLDGRVYRVKPWSKWPMARRIAFLRAFVEDTSRDPAIARKATEILKAAGVDPKDHRAAWAALLRWVQQNVYYVNERDERLQSPQYTLTEKHGDCDDCAIVLAALGDSIRLPWKYAISGRGPKGIQVWTEGGGPVPDIDWSHIFVQVGGPPFKPTWWTFAEPTLHVPLGWSVLSGRSAPGRADMGGLAGLVQSAESALSPNVGASTTPAPTSGGALSWLPWKTIAAGAVTSALSYALAAAIMKGGKRLKSSR